MSSPMIVEVVGELSGTLSGKEAVGAYWAIGLQRRPDLHFDLISTLTGVDSVTLYYRGQHGLSAECFHFGSDQKVVRAYAPYAA